MIKGVIFDLDGTLLDTLGDLLSTMNEMLDKYNCPLVCRETAIKNIGQGASEYIYGCLPENKKYLSDECNVVYRNMLNKCGLKYTKLYDGISQALMELNQKGIKLAILSNKPQSSTEIAYNKFLKKFNFSYVAGQRDNDLPKPDTSTLLRVIKELNLKCDEVVMVGDGDADVKVALIAGIKHISVLWGYRTKQQLIDSGAVNFAKNTDEMLKIINMM
jgi:phosphoglycolate phosphatase